MRTSVKNTLFDNVQVFKHIDVTTYPNKADIYELPVRI
jgi:hypothetical protein